MGHQLVKNKILQLYDELVSHDGFADLHIEMRILRRGQKEIILHCGKQYRYVVDFKNSNDNSSDNSSLVGEGS